MFNIGDMIVYGATGVCRVEDITTPEFSRDRSKIYYALSPLFQDGMIYVPVDTKIFMRPVISAEEAEKLIDAIPGVRAEAYYNSRLQVLATHYEEALRTHDCRDLIELSMSLYLKRRDMESQKRKFGQIDTRFMKRAEDLLFGELSVALGIARDEVSAYIEERVGSKLEDGGAADAAQ